MSGAVNKSDLLKDFACPSLTESLNLMSFKIFLEKQILITDSHRPRISDNHTTRVNLQTLD